MERDVELLLLGAVLANATFSRAAFERLNGSDFKERDLGNVFEELRRGSVGETAKAWMKRRGMNGEGMVVELAMATVAESARKRRLEQLANRLRLAIAAGCEEEVQACVEALSKERER